jgi:hypothetical protein
MSLIDVIGKALFPQSARSERRHKVKLTLIFILAALGVVAVLILVIYLLNLIVPKPDELLQQVSFLSPPSWPNPMHALPAQLRTIPEAMGV